MDCTPDSGCGFYRATYDMLTELTLANAVASRQSLLLTCASGVSSETVARRIHEASSHSYGAFIPIRCAAAISRETLHVAVSFAIEGTLFLEGLERLSLVQQGTLADLLERRAIDVRVIASTAVDLTSMVASGAFRSDLYLRFGRIRLRMPPPPG